MSETPLPGVGIRFEFQTASGRRVAVIHHRSGRKELTVDDDVFPGVFFLFFGFQVDPSSIPSVAIPATLLAAVGPLATHLVHRAGTGSARG